MWTFACSITSKAHFCLCKVRYHYTWWSYSERTFVIMIILTHDVVHCEIPYIIIIMMKQFITWTNIAPPCNAWLLEKAQAIATSSLDNQQKNQQTCLDPHPMECNVQRQPPHTHLKYPKSSYTHNQHQPTPWILDTHDVESLSLIVGMSVHRNFDAFDFCNNWNKYTNKHCLEIGTKKTHPKSNSSTILLCCVVFEVAVFYQSFGCILNTDVNVRLS